MSQAPTDASVHPSILEARRVLEVEADAIRGLVEHLDQTFVDVVELIATCAGRVIFNVDLNALELSVCLSFSHGSLQAQQ